MSATAPQRRYAKRLPPAERREQILDAALHLIVEQGFPAVSMEAVARAAGVAKPVVYDFFANRGELMAALLEREEERALEGLAGVVPELPFGEALDPDTYLVGGMTAWLRAVQENPDTWRVIMLPVEGTPAVLRENVDSAKARAREALEAFVAWATAQRGGPEGLDVEAAAHMIQAVAERAAALVLTEPELYSPERLASFCEQVLAALSRGVERPSS
jgi:AcrR family transcriptional regulator